MDKELWVPLVGIVVLWFVTSAISEWFRGVRRKMESRYESRYEERRYEKNSA